MRKKIPSGSICGPVFGSRLAWTRLAATSATLTVLAAVTTGCAGGDSATSGSDSKTVTVYSSLPLQGASRPLYTSMVNGIKLALKHGNNRAGRFHVKYVSLDDSTAQAGTWTPEAVSANARRAAHDERAVAYIGEGNSGGTAVSLPILNEAGLLQVAGSNTAVGLTSDGAGSLPGEPDIYYPTEKRNYIRLVPRDTVQSRALVKLMLEGGCKKLALANDKEVYGAGLARSVTVTARARGLKVVANDAIDPKSANYRSLAAKFERQKADCFLYTGVAANNSVQLYKNVAAALPDAKLYGPDGIAENDFTDPKAGGVPPEIARRVQITFAALAPSAYPAAGKRFFAEYRKTYESDPESYAIYAYECMRLILDAIKRADEGGADRAAVVKAAFATKNVQSALGSYSINKNGDTTLTAFGIYTIDDGRLEFAKTITTK